jgi:hypothetical protein
VPGASPPSTEPRRPQSGHVSLCAKGRSVLAMWVSAQATVYKILKQIQAVSFWMAVALLTTFRLEPDAEQQFGLIGVELGDR